MFPRFFEGKKERKENIREEVDYPSPEYNYCFASVRPDLTDKNRVIDRKIGREKRERPPTKGLRAAI